MQLYKLCIKKILLATSPIGFKSWWINLKISQISLKNSTLILYFVKCPTIQALATAYRTIYLEQEVIIRGKLKVALSIYRSSIKDVTTLIKFDISSNP